MRHRDDHVVRHEHNHKGRPPECYGCPDEPASKAPRDGEKLITFCDGPLQGQVHSVPRGSSVWVALDYDDTELSMQQLVEGVRLGPVHLTARQVTYHFHRFAFVIGDWGVTFWVGSLDGIQPGIHDFVHSVLRPEVAAGVTVERMPPRPPKPFPSGSPYRPWER